MMRFWSTAYTQHLEGEMAWLRIEMNRAQQRYEIATAELVRLRTDGHANVHPQPLIPPTLDDPKLRADLDAMTSNPDWAQAGT